MLMTLPVYIFVSLTLQLTANEIYGSKFQCYCGKNGGQGHNGQNQQLNQQNYEQSSRQQFQQSSQQQSQQSSQQQFQQSSEKTLQQSSQHQFQQSSQQQFQQSSDLKLKESSVLQNQKSSEQKLQQSSQQQFQQSSDQKLKESSVQQNQKSSDQKLQQSSQQQFQQSSDQKHTESSVQQNQKSSEQKLQQSSQQQSQQSSQQQFQQTSQQQFQQSSQQQFQQSNEQKLKESSVQKSHQSSQQNHQTSSVQQCQHEISQQSNQQNSEQKQQEQHQQSCQSCQSNQHESSQHHGTAFIPVPIPIPGKTSQTKPTNTPPNNNCQTNNNNYCPPKCNYCTRCNCDPGSCKAVPNFDAAEDAKRLQNAVKSSGTDEKTMIDILTQRSDDQIEMIRQEYIRFGRTLRSDIDGDTSMKTKDLLRALQTPRPLFYAEELNKALKAKDSDTLIEILSSLSDCAIREVSSEYEQVFHKSLPESIDKNTCGDFENLLRELAKGNRNPNQNVDVEQAKKDADELIKSGVKKWCGTDETKFINIFAQRSWPQLREVIKQYEQKRPSGIEKDIKSETSGKLQEGLLTLVKNARDQSTYLADELDKAVDSMILPVPGDNDKLIRIMRGRCGVDLGDIRDAYPKTHNNKKLADRLSSKTYMDYEAALLAMIKG